MAETKKPCMTQVLDSLETIVLWYGQVTQDFECQHGEECISSKPWNPKP